ncbi:MAG TPA: hypothetical protein VE907_08065 [Gammaproteobacteria bacterium]|nr:hypothetical protein [Gammaproteobacteria bacterium]
MSRLARASIVLASAAAALLGGQVFAQPPAPAATAQAEAPDQPTDEVIVRGRRMSDVQEELRLYVNKFVVEVAKPAGARGYARWQRGVCVSVSNLKPEAAQYLVDHISHVAAEVGLEPGEPGCNPQVIVIFTVDGKAMASSMVENDPRVFRPFGPTGGGNQGYAELDDFVQSDRAVRWWHVSLPVSAQSGVKAITTTGDKSAPVISVAGPSRIHSGIRDDLLYVLIVVDSKKLAGTTWQQLGDYLSVVALAQVDPQANPSDFDSILNVFSNPAAYSGLTDWDRSYLKALYSFDQERTARMQVNELVGKMTRQELEPIQAGQ